MRHFMTHTHDCLIVSESDARDLRLAGKETLGLVEKMSRSHRYKPITSFVKVASEKEGQAALASCLAGTATSRVERYRTNH